MKTRIWQQWHTGLVHAVTLFGIGLAGIPSGGEEWPEIE
jgi:hypothetical protein